MRENRMIPPVVVGITGLKRHGKDTAAKLLVNEYGFTKLSFADKLKDIVAIAFNVPREWLDDDTMKEAACPMYPDWTIRKLMQFVGTEMFRKTFPGIWLDLWMAEAMQHDRVVVPDVRFDNERALVKSFGRNLMIRVVDPRRPPNADMHASETGIMTMPVDWELTNAGSIGDLHAGVRNIIESSTVLQYMS